MFLLNYVKKEKGAAAILAVMLVLFFVTTLTFVVVRITIQDVRISRDISRSFRAYETSISGVERGSFEVRNGSVFGVGGFSDTVESGNYNVKLQGNDLVSVGQYGDLERHIEVKDIVSKIVPVTGGVDSSFALAQNPKNTNGKVWFWGGSDYGESGDATDATRYNNNSNNKLAPQTVLDQTGISDLVNIKKIAAGADHVLALDANDNVWSWGYNTYGQLGIGPQGLVDGAGAPNVGRYTAIDAVDASIVYVSYYDVDNGNLKFAKTTDGGATPWTVYTIPDPDSAGNVGQYTSIYAVDAGTPSVSGDDTIYISYYDVTNTALKFAKTTDGGAAPGSWSFKTVDNAGLVGQYSSISASTADPNTIYISYYDDTGDDLKVAKSTDGGDTWPSLATVDSAGNVGQFTSIDAVDASTVYVSYRDVTNTALKFAKYDGTSWTVPPSNPIDTTGNAGMDYTSIDAVDSSTIYISYAIPGNPQNDLMFAKTTNGGDNWSKILVDDYNNAGQYSSIKAIDANNIFISYNQSLEGIRFAKTSNGGNNTSDWIIEDLDNTSGSSGQSYTSIDAIDVNNIFVSYYHSGGGDLKVAKSTSGGDNWGISNKWLPQQVLRDDGTCCLSNIKDIAAGLGHSLALDEDGNVWSWGKNEISFGLYGVLGDGTAIRNKFYPGKVVGENGIGTLTDPDNDGVIDRTITEISAGSWHNFAKDGDGFLWAWGDNRYGDLGVNSSDNSKLLPVKVKDIDGVSDLRNVKKFSAGAFHSLAIDSDGNLLSWGYNNLGRLGINSGNFALEQLYPVKVVGENGIGTLTDPDNDGVIDRTITEISAGNTHSLALDSNSFVWSWGNNTYGQLGIGGFGGNQLYPVQAKDNSGTNYLSDVIRIALSGASSFASDADGRVWAWGDNSNGQLGDNDPVPPSDDKNLPIETDLPRPPF